MEKISGILPSSSRVAAVDMREAAPVRPGTPAFGRAEGVSSLRDAKLGDTANRAVKISQEQLDWRAKDMKNAATVRELSDRFFRGNQKAVDANVEAVIDDGLRPINTAPLSAPVESVPAGFDFGRTPSSRPDGIEQSSAQPDGLHPRGSFVDVRA